MTLLEILVSFIVGLVSGVASGWVVSDIFKKNGAKEEFYKEFSDDKQKTVRFLQSLKLELDIIGEAIKSGEKPNFEDIRRRIDNPPITLTFGSGKITEVSQSRIQIKNEIVAEVRDCIASGDLDVRGISSLSRKLFRAQIEILDIETIKK
ncbi:hypothetical protein [Brevibacillus centrosporus]|uniref:hypothetical protein n=1 Tax=Brevibacillus centrosporus TaxID=54910 RepID=UPI003B011D69